MGKALITIQVVTLCILMGFAERGGAESAAVPSSSVDPLTAGSPNSEPPSSEPPRAEPLTAQPLTAQPPPSGSVESSATGSSMEGAAAIASEAAASVIENKGEFSAGGSVERVPLDREPAQQSAEEEKAALMQEVRSPDAISETSRKKSAPPSGSKALSVPQGVRQYQYEGYSSAPDSRAVRKKITDEAVAQTSEKAVISIIGEARYRKKKAQIVEKIFKQSSRYIPVIKAGAFIETAEGNKLTVELLLNQETLSALLQKEGFLFDNEGVALVMPFISIDDQIRGGSYRWWRSRESQLEGLSEFMETQIQKNFFGLGFYVQRPQTSHLENIIPSGYRQDDLTPEQIQKICRDWQVPLAMVGDLTIHKGENQDVIFDVRVSVLQISTGRTMAQLYRQLRLPKRVQLNNLNLRKDLGFLVQAYRDLGAQMQDALNRGVFSTTTVRLEVEGNFPINKYVLFKEALKQSHRSIRQVRERLITSKKVLFELDVNGTAEEIASGLNRVSVGDRIYYSKGLSDQQTIQLAVMGGR